MNHLKIKIIKQCLDVPLIAEHNILGSMLKTVVSILEGNADYSGLKSNRYNSLAWLRGAAHRTADRDLESLINMKHLFIRVNQAAEDKKLKKEAT